MKRNILIKISIILLIISSVLVNVFAYINVEKQDMNKRIVLDEETQEETVKEIEKKESSTEKPKDTSSNKKNRN